jgi:hypothetical protein
MVERNSKYEIFSDECYTEYKIIEKIKQDFIESITTKQYLKEQYEKSIREIEEKTKKDMKSLEEAETFLSNID